MLINKDGYNGIQLIKNHLVLHKLLIGLQKSQCLRKCCYLDHSLLSAEHSQGSYWANRSCPEKIINCSHAMYSKITTYSKIVGYLSPNVQHNKRYQRSRKLSGTTQPTSLQRIGARWWIDKEDRQIQLHFRELWTHSDHRLGTQTWDFKAVLRCTVPGNYWYGCTDSKCSPYL